MAVRTLTVWRFLDGKPGHEKQSLGLCRALARLHPAAVHEIRAGPRWRDAGRWLTGRYAPGATLARPDLLVVAGHGTHLAGLAARRAHGGRLVAIMRPSLPSRCFDACLIPEHDEPEAAEHIVATRGALNNVTTSARHDSATGVILLGGPSAHYAWDSAHIAAQVLRVVRAQAGVRWTLSDSRRTPADLIERLRADLPADTCLYRHSETPPGWLEQTLATAGQAWVSEDSVSMLYEALTAGCRVGLLRLPRSRAGRVARGVERLLAEGWIMSYEGWQAGVCPAPPTGVFDEAGRCAHWILDRWFPSAG